MSPKLTLNDKLRLVLLYGIRFEKHANSATKFLTTLSTTTDLDLQDITTVCFLSLSFIITPIIVDYYY